jgi:hypothetical protein
MVISIVSLSARRVFRPYLQITDRYQIITLTPLPNFSPPPPPLSDINWHANFVYDPVTPIVTGFVWPNSQGNCIPFLGVVVPGGLLSSQQAQGSAAWAVYQRVNTAAISSLDISTAGRITGVLAGLPTDQDAQSLLAIVYSRHPTGNDANPYSFTGPLAPNNAVCSQAAAAPVNRPGDGSGTFTIPCTGACATAQDLVVVITTGALNIIPNAPPGTLPQPGDAEVPGGNGICVNYALPNDGFPLPPGVLGTSYLFLAFSRATPPLPSQLPPSESSSISQSPTISDSQSGTDSGSPSLSPTAAVLQVVTVTVTVTRQPVPLGIVEPLSASSATAIYSFGASLALAIATGLAMLLV